MASSEPFLSGDGRPSVIPWRLPLVLLIAAAILFVHYITPATPQNMVVHDLHRLMLYIPIILAAFWYGWRGGMLMAVVVGTAYFAHGQQHARHDHLGRLSTINIVLEMLLFVVVGGVMGRLIDRLRGEQRNLRQANAQLRQAMDHLTEKTREVFAAEEQLRRADRLAAIGHLTAGLAHEIRNPLASLRGAAEILGDDHVPAAQRRDFSVILIEETERLDRVLGNFLEYARSQKPDAPRSCDLPQALGKIRALLEKKMQNAGIRLHENIHHDLPLVAMAEDLLRQVLLNLLLNAIQSMEKGGEISVEAVPAPQGRFIRLTITDQGPGIPEHLAEHIFDPFFTTKAQGTGLGLAIVHKIMASHGGSIALDPRHPAGARFQLLMPIE